MPTRRRFLQLAGGAIAGGAGLFGYTWRIEPEWLVITLRLLPVAGLPPALDGKLLAQLSDLHIGPIVDSNYILRTFDRVRDIAPDFVAMTGDWITYRGSQQLEELSRLLPRFPHGRLGTVGILGNHDYGYQWRMDEVAAGVSERTRGAGIQLLRNERVEVAGLSIIGLDDYWSPHFDPSPILAESRRPGTLVLSHNPDSLDHADWHGYQGWILSGHTHGGQCKPPFLPPPLLPVQNRRYTSGEIPLDDGRRVYINRGVGYVSRVRFNARPEVTLFTLKAA